MQRLRVTKGAVLPAMLLALGLILSAAFPVSAGAGAMKVEEPARNAPKPPIEPEKDKEGWKEKPDAGLTAAQKEIQAARQERMAAMVALIRQKRRAIKDAKPKDKQALALELQNLILEKSQVAEKIHGESKLSLRGTGKGSAGLSESLERGEKSARILESKQRQIDEKAGQLDRKEEAWRQQEARRKWLEERMREWEKRPENRGKGVSDDD